MMNYELQPTALWEISTTSGLCHLVIERNYSAYEETDCFSETADDIVTNHTKPSLNSEETIFFRMNFRLQKTGQAKRS